MNFVMSLVNKIKNSSQPTREEFSLSKQEIEILLNMIKTNTFLGEHVEHVYSLVYKLQQQYITQEN